MPEYNVKVNGKTYRVKSDRPLQPAEAYQYASMQSGFKAPESPKPTTRAEAKAQGKPRSTLENIKRYGQMAVGAVGDVVREQAMPILANVGPGMLLPEPARRALQGEVGSKAIDYLTGREKLEKQIGPRTDREKMVVETGKGVLSAVTPGGKKEVALQMLGGGLGSATAEGIKQHGGGEGWQIAGGLLAGIVPQTLISGAKQTVGKIGSYFTGEGAKERAATIAQHHAGGTDAALEAAQALENRPRPSPGTRPTLGETARNPGLAALEREHPSTPIQTQRRRNAQARARTLDTTFGEGNTQDVQDLATRKVREGETRLQMRERNRLIEQQNLERQREASRVKLVGETDEAFRVRQAQADADLAAKQIEGEDIVRAQQETGEQALQDKIAGVGPAASRIDSARDIRPVITREHQAAKDLTSEMYNDDLLVNPHPIEMAPRMVNRLFKGIESKIDQFFGNAAGKVPDKTSQALKDMLAEIDADNFNSATVANIDKRLADFAGEVRVSKGRDNSAAAFAESLRDEIAKATDKFIPDDVKEALMLAKAARRDQSARFESGTAKLGPIIDEKRFGFDKTPDTELAGRLVAAGHGGATLGVELKNAVGEEAATKLVAEEMRRLIEEGKITTEKQLKSTYGPVLEQFPGVKAAVAETIGQRTANKLGLTEAKLTRKQIIDEQVAANKAALAETEAAGKARVREHEVETSGLVGLHKQETADILKDQEAANRAFKATALGSTYGDKNDPIAAIGDLLKDAKDGGRGMAELREQIKEGGEAAERGVRRALAGYVDRALSQGAGFDEFGEKIPGNKNGIAAIDDVLERSGDLLDDKQRQVLEQIREELKAVDFAKFGGVAENPNERLPTIPAKTSFVRNSIKALIEQFGNTDKMNTIIRDAIMDPSLAPELLKRPSPARLRKIARTLKLSASGAMRAVNTTAGPTYPEEGQ